MLVYDVYCHSDLCDLLFSTFTRCLEATWCGEMGDKLLSSVNQRTDDKDASSVK